MTLIGVPNTNYFSEITVMLKATKVESEEEIFNPDIVLFNILNLDVPDEDPKEYNIKATFMEQLVISGTMTSNKKQVKHEVPAGEIEYDPSDYRRINKFADTPLAVLIKPAILYEYEETVNIKQKPLEKLAQEESNDLEEESYYCNIDILNIFTDVSHLLVERRMESTSRSVLYAKSWRNLPLITIEIIAKRNEKNTQHHNILRDANFLKFTVIGCYNMNISSDDTISYSCLTEMPMCNAQSTYVALFENGERDPRLFNYTSFHPKWESLRAEEDNHAKSDEKFSCDDIKEFYNPENLDLAHIDNKNAVLWTSFHRSLIVKSAEESMYNYFHHHQWPVEVHLCGEERHCFVAFLDLMKLIYPGEHSIRLAVPLQRVLAELSPEECVGEYLVSRTVSSTRFGSTKTNKETWGSIPTNADTKYSSTASVSISAEHDPFILVEIKLARPLRKSSVPPRVSNAELMGMLRREEQSAQPRRCAGRSHTNRHWEERVRAAAQLLYTLPQRDVCTFDHDLNTSKTQVEIETSFWQEAAHYVNNNFIPSQFLESDESLEELRMMAHVYMMRAVTETVIGTPLFEERSHLLRAARQARQMQDVPHAIDLYLQLLATHKRDSDLWRELANCYKDVDKKLANVCIDKALKLCPRHPLSLLAKACLVMDEDIDGAEVFFLAMFALYPFCTLLWIVGSAYYFLRGLHDSAQQIMGYVTGLMCEDIPESPHIPRTWNCELGDWWDHTPLPVGCSLYYDAADLLLRIRGITLAEVCVALSLPEAGATPMYYHLLALCCRLRGDTNTALCHLQHARARNGACYLYSLEGECHYNEGNLTAAKMCLENSIYYSQPFSILLAISTSSLSGHEINITRSVLMDLVRRQPSAYAWTKLAQFLLTTVFQNMNTLTRLDTGGSLGDQNSQDSSTHYVVACAEQALKYDRYFKYAWTILSKTVKPAARRIHCQNMATRCGRMFDGFSFDMNLKLPHGDLIGKTMEECQCQKKEEL